MPGGSIALVELRSDQLTRSIDRVEITSSLHPIASPNQLYTIAALLGALIVLLDCSGHITSARRKRTKLLRTQQREAEAEASRIQTIEAMRQLVMLHEAEVCS